MSDFLDRKDPGVKHNVRPGAGFLQEEQIEKFPYEAFETSKVNETNPVLTLKDPWLWQFNWKVVNGTDDVTLTDGGHQLVLFTRQGTDKTITMPDATKVSVGCMVMVRVSGSGTGDVLYATVGSQTLDGELASVWEHNGTGTIVWMSDGSNWIPVSTGVWDSGDVSDSGDNINRSFRKLIIDVMVQEGERSGITMVLNNIGIGTFGWSYYTGAATATFGLPFTGTPRVYPGSDETGSNRAQSLGIDLVTSSTFRLHAFNTNSSTKSESYMGIGPWR